MRYKYFGIIHVFFLTPQLSPSDYLLGDASDLPLLEPPPELATSTSHDSMVHPSMTVFLLLDCHGSL